MVCIEKTSMTSDLSSLEEGSKESDIDTNSKRFIFGEKEFHIPPDIKRILPASALGTDHVRFDLLQLHGHKDVIKKLHSENYKFCLGCAYFDDANQCHSVEVCDHDALCINGSFPEHIHWTIPGVFQLNTDPWYGCCKPGSNCRSADKNVTIHVANLYPVDFQYKLQTCNDLLCNAGKYFEYYVTEFRNIFKGQNTSLSPTSTLGSYNTPSMIRIQPTSTRSIQPTSVYGFQQSPVVNIQSAAPGSQSPQHSTDAALTSKHFYSTSTMQLQPSFSMKLSSTQAITNSFTTHQSQSTLSFQLQSLPPVQPVQTSSTTMSNTKSIRPSSIASTSSVQSKTTSVYRPSVTPAEVFTPSPSVNIIQTSNAAQQMPPKKPMPTRPPTAVKCAVCSGPLEACALAYYEDYCQPPNNYCINHVTNLVNGDRLVERKCGNITNCYRDWYQGSSDNDKCRQLSANNIMTYRFECTYCCVTDGCNVDLRPRDNTLYTFTL